MISGTPSAAPKSRFSLEGEGTHPGTRSWRSIYRRTSWRGDPGTVTPVNTAKAEHGPPLRWGTQRSVSPHVQRPESLPPPFQDASEGCVRAGASALSSPRNGQDGGWQMDRLVTRGSAVVLRDDGGRKPLHPSAHCWLPASFLRRGCYRHPSSKYGTQRTRISLLDFKMLGAPASRPPFLVILLG